MYILYIIIMDNLTFFRKKQTNSSNSVLNDENYFLKPHLKIVLTSPQIHEINSKYLVFKCLDEDVEKLSKLSDDLIEKFKSQIILNDKISTIHPLLKKNLFRCVISNTWTPNKYINYNLQFYVNDSLCKFQLNKINKDTKIDKVVIFVKNIWSSNDKCGIHCVVDELYVNN